MCNIGLIPIRVSKTEKLLFFNNMCDTDNIHSYG